MTPVTGVPASQSSRQKFVIFAIVNKDFLMDKDVQGWNVRKGDYRSEDEYARMYSRHRNKEKIVKNTFLAFTAVAVASLMYLVLWFVSRF